MLHVFFLISYYMRQRIVFWAVELKLLLLY